MLTLYTSIRHDILTPPLGRRIAILICRTPYKISHKGDLTPASHKFYKDFTLACLKISSSSCES